MNKSRYFFDIRRPFFAVELLLGFYILIFIIAAGPIAAIATRVGLLAVLLFSVLLFLRNETDRFIYALRPIIPYFLFFILSLALLPLIPEARFRVRNNFTALLTISIIYYITRRNGKLPMVEFCMLLSVLLICGLFVFAPGTLIPPTGTNQRMRFGISALGHDSGMGASTISLNVGIACFIALRMLYNPEFQLYMANKKSLRFLILGIMGVSAFAVIAYSGSRQGLIWVSLVVATLSILQSRGNLMVGLFKAGIAAIVLIGAVFIFFKDLTVVQRVTIFFDPLRQFEAENSFLARKDMILSGLEWWKESPIWGNGNEAFRVLYGGFYSHNNYIELLVNYGLLGATFFYAPLLGMFFGSLKRISKPQAPARIEFIWIASSVLAILVSNMFLPSYYMRPMLFFYSYLVGYYAYLKDVTGPRRIIPHPHLRPTHAEYAAISTKTPSTAHDSKSH